MRLRHLYLGLCVLGVVLPYAEFIPWLSQHGLQLGAFVHELFSTRIGAFFGLDVVLSAVALFVFIFAECKVVAIRHVWLPVIATLVVGVSRRLFPVHRMADHHGAILPTRAGRHRRPKRMEFRLQRAELANIYSTSRGVIISHTCRSSLMPLMANL